VAFIFGGTALLGIVYGAGARTIKSDSDAIEGMGKSMETLGVYIVLCFFAAQFVAYFKWTNLGLIFAVKGAGALQASGLGEIPLMIAFVLVSAVINLAMGSALAKWAIMAPEFIPMFMLLGNSPELVQATMLPYSTAFFLVWTVLLIARCLLGLPIGPGAPLKLA
jgi:aminobenzoyl-glutamate transport protein